MCPVETDIIIMKLVITPLVCRELSVSAHMCETPVPHTLCSLCLFMY